MVVRLSMDNKVGEHNGADELKHRNGQSPNNEESGLPNDVESEGLLNNNNDNDNGEDDNGKTLKEKVKTMEGLSDVAQLVDKIKGKVRLYIRTNPQLSKAIGIFCGILLIKVLFFRHKANTDVVYVPPHLARHYGNVQSYYDLKISQIDHWCLTGGDHGCKCDDPTEELPRNRVPGWTSTFEKNKELAKTAPKDLDVVFYGDQIVQSWTGLAYERPVMGGKRLATLFDQNFQKQRGGSLNGLALGIADDTISNLLFRLQNGEMPKTLTPKVFWLLIGTNDLTVGHCSEEAVVVGILRLADEIAMQNPTSTVVVQGLLPQSVSPDGSLATPPAAPPTAAREKMLARRRNNTLAASFQDKERFRNRHEQTLSQFQYPLWPSIKVINEELKAFCENHDHMVYMDPLEVFVGTIGNDYYKSSDQYILNDLLPRKSKGNPSDVGHQIWIKYLGEKLGQIITQPLVNPTVTPAVP